MIAPIPAVAIPDSVVVTPASAPVRVPSLAANGAPLSAEVRENLRLQAGYMHPVKFRDPSTGAGWTGRGPKPKWLKDLCLNGKTIKNFRVIGLAYPPSLPLCQLANEAPTRGAQP